MGADRSNDEGSVMERRVFIAWRDERVYPEFTSEGLGHDERREKKIPAARSAVLRSLCANCSVLIYRAV